MRETKPKRKVDPEFMRQIGSKGGQASAISPNSPRPFRDVPGLASQAGKKSKRGKNRAPSSD